jgi:hypothetical protein
MGFGLAERGSGGQGLNAPPYPAIALTKNIALPMLSPKSHWGQTGVKFERP